jgi:TolB-like protein
VADETIPAADLLAQLDRILSSPGFATAGRGSRFLRYVVEQTVAGNGENLKEFSLGVEVFDRGESFDPRVDSIVRVEAGRLRSKLDEYYNGDGKLDAVRIGLPRGGYVPQFERFAIVGHPFSGADASMGTRASNGQSAFRETRTWSLAIGVAVLLLVTAMWFGGSRQPTDAAVPGGVTIAVLAFEQYSETAERSTLAAEITDGVTSELARLGTIGVASHTSAMQFAGVRKPLKEIARALGADVVLEASIMEGAGGLRVTARMVDARVDRKIWVEDFPGTRTDLRDLERRIAVAASAAALAKRTAP